MRGLKRAGLILILFAIISKTLGILREVLIAYYFGTSSGLDAYIIGMTIPLNIMQLLTGGAFVAAFIPIFTEYLSKNNENRAWVFGCQIINLNLLLFLALSLICLLLAPFLIKLIAPGFNKETHQLATRLTQIMLPSMLFFSLASISQSILNSFGDFILPGLRQTTLNLSLILMIVLGTASLGVYALAIGFLVGSASQLFIQFPSLIKRIRYYFKISLADEATKCFFFLFLPLLLGMVINQLNILVDKIVASLLGPGNVSALNYAERMMEMTKSVLGVAVATVIFPHLSIASYKKDLEDFIQPLKKGINLLFFTTFPITLSFLFFTSPIIEILFKRGLFGDTSLTLTSQALFYYAFAAFFITINYVLIRAFYALRKVKLTVIATTFCLIINIVLNLTLSRVMGVGGITAATSISNGLLFFLLMYLLDKEVGLEIRSWLLRVVIIGMTQLIAFGLGFCIYNVLAGFENILMIRLSVVAIIILASLCLLSWLFKIEEFNWIVSLIRRKTQG